MAAFRSKFMKHLTILLAIVSFLAADAVAAAPKPRHGGFFGSLGSGAGATDIIRADCGVYVPPAGQPGITINQARARIKDTSPVAQPALNVHIAQSTLVAGIWTCGAYTPAKRDDTSTTGAAQAYGLNSPDNNGIFSDWTATVVMPAVGGKYCIKISKTADNQNTGSGGTAVGAENYELDSHCEQGGNPNHAISTGFIYLQDQ
jgi:hypothetical protein